MFHLGKTIQFSTTNVVRTFHTTKPLFLFGSGVIKVKQRKIIIIDLYENNFMQEGATLPNHTLYENEPKNKVNTKDLFAGKKGSKQKLKFSII